MCASQAGQTGWDKAAVANPPQPSVLQRIKLSHVLLASLMLLAFAEMAWLSVARYRGYNAFVFDLGVMSQAIWSGSQGQPLIFSTQGIPFSRLARHVELIYFALAPVYRLFPSPITPLIAQSLLYAVGAFPLYRLAHRRLNHSGAALSLVAIYFLYPVMQTAVLFDIHGDTLAVPFLLFAVEAADRHAWRSYGIWVALALSCKVYVAIPVAVLGVILWLNGKRRAGIWTTILAVIWGAFSFFVLRAAFAPNEGALVHATTTSYIEQYFGQVGTLGQTGLARLVNLAIVVLPVLLLAWRSPYWFLAALAIIVPVALSTGPGPSYDYRYHHYVLAVPFLIVASAYAAEKLRSGEAERRVQDRRWRWHLPIAMSLLLTALMNSFFVNTPLSPGFFRAPLGSGLGLDDTSYGSTPRDRMKDTWLLTHVPDKAPVAANGSLGTRLVNRSILYLTDYPRAVRPLESLLSEVDYVVADSLFDFAMGSGDKVNDGGINYEKETIELMLETPEFGLVDERDGLLLFERGRQGLRQSLSSQSMTAAPVAVAEFGGAIGLVAAEVRGLGQGRYAAHFKWASLKPLANESQFVAVTRLEGVEHSRIPHLPTMVFKPTSKWRPEELIDEQFEFEVPQGLASGTYPLLLGWYDSSLLVATETDARSRLGEEVVIGQVTVP